MRTFCAMKLLLVALAIVRDNAATTTTADMTTSETTVESTSFSSTSPTETTMQPTSSTSSTFNTSTSTMSSNETSSAVSTMAYNGTASTTTSPFSETSLLCLSGSCFGNISCLQEFENVTCYLQQDQHCFLQVYTNSTNIFYTAGCLADCEEMSIQAGMGNNSISSEMYCCDDRDRCNLEIQEASNSATSFGKFGVSIALLIVLSFFFSVWIACVFQ